MSCCITWILLAQYHQRNAADEAASGAMGLLCCGLMVGIPLLYVGIVVTMSFWMARDAKTRGLEPAMWLIMTFFTGPIGFAYYLFSRPQGMLTQCHNCGNNRLEASLKCPHCGAGRAYRDNDDEEEEEEEDRPRPKKSAISRRSASDAASVIVCPHCKVRLRLPNQPAAFGQEYTCPNCHRRIDTDK